MTIKDFFYTASTDCSDGTYNRNKLFSEVDAANIGPGVSAIGESVNGDDFTVIMAGTLTTAQETSLDAVVAAHTGYSLDDHKAARCEEIDTRSGELIATGFTYDGHSFSSSGNAQFNMLALFVLENMLAWPKPITKMSNQKYELAQANKTAYVGAGLAHVAGILESGLDLKDAVMLKTDKAGIDAVVDNR